MIRNKVFIIFFLALLCIFVAKFSANSENKSADKESKTVFYVSNDGNDQWSGTLSMPNSAKNDGPFATLKGARDAIRMKRATRRTGGFTVFVRGGIYRLNETFTLDPEDSGTASEPTIFKAYPGEYPVLSGAKVIENFRPYNGQILKADLQSVVLPSGRVSQVFANGKRQIMARFPNADPANPTRSGFSYVEDSVNEGSKTRFKYREGSVRRWANDQNGEVFIYSGKNWCNDIVPVKQIDRDSRVVTLAMNASYPVLRGNRYFFQNVLEELDSPGEWVFDLRNRILYYWPENEASPQPVSVPILKSIVEIKQKIYLGKYTVPPYHIRLEGFTFEGCDGSAVVVNKGTNIVVAGCTVMNAGGNGIVINGGTENTVFGNDILEVGGTGIFLSGGDQRKLIPARNRAENNYIHHVGVVNKTTTNSGIYCGGVGNVVAHNLVHSTPRMAIFFDGNDHVIEYNHVHHGNQETQDSGLICSCPRDWTKRGNVVRFNYVHDSGGYGRDHPDQEWRSPFYTWGIYLDDWTSGTEVYGNIIVNTCRGGIFVHGGRDNIIQNNIIFEGGKGQMVYSSIPPTAKELPEMIAMVTQMGYEKYPLLATIKDAQQGTTMSGNKFLRNIVYYKDKKSLLYDIYGTLDLGTTESDYNVIYHAGLPLLVPYTKAANNLQWAKWKDSGLDPNSIIADPLFVDIAKSDFRLSPNSPAFKVGFKPIPFEKIGPYKDPLRASWPLPPQDIKAQQIPVN